MMKPNTPAAGYKRVKSYSPKIAITFDPTVFEKIRATAIQRHVSFSQVARELINAGIKAEEVSHD